MKYAKHVAEALLVLLATYFITRWWFGTAWSERYWTWLNGKFGGQNPGLASDIELVTILLLALVISIGVLITIFHLVIPSLQKMSGRTPR